MLQTDASIQRRPDVTAAVMLMENDLLEDDIEGIKFLCQGLVPGGKLKPVKNVHELAILLEKKNVLSESDHFILGDLLAYIRRIDVLEELGYVERDVMQQRRHMPSRIQPFYILLYQIAEELCDDDVKRAKYIYSKVPRSQTVSSGLDLFTIMVQHKAIWPENVTRLKEIFRSIERMDLVELIKRYEDTNGQSVIDELEENFRRSLSLRGETLDTPQVPHLFGTGPSLDDHDVKRRINTKTPQNVSDDMSMETQPPSNQYNSDPSDPLGSYSSVRQSNTSDQSSNSNAIMEPKIINSNITLESLPSLTPAPADYNEIATGIPWQIVDTISREVLVVYWPQFSARLGMPLNDDMWRRVKPDTSHKLVILKQWLNLPETKALGTYKTRVALVDALNGSGATLMAQELANLLGVRAELQGSISSHSSAYDTNETSSSASAAHIPNSVETTTLIRENVRLATAEMQTTGGAAAYVSPMRSTVVPYYLMNHKPRGYCVIINNRKFYVDPRRPESKQMIEREGTDVDKEKLIEIFKHLHFNVTAYDDLTDVEMVQALGRFSLQDHSSYDCFACCILTHGVQGALYGCNGVTVPIKDLTGPFRAQACHTLAGKPKLFFMQACQGREKQPGFPDDMQQDCHLETDGPAEMIPNEADFLLGYATTPGYVSYRSKTRGSWYITKLTEMLMKHSSDHDILDILTLVNFEVGKGDAMVDGGRYKQSPAPMYTLRKKLVFMPL